MAERVVSIEIGRSITRICETDYKGKGQVYRHFAFESPKNVFDGQKISDIETYAPLLVSQLREHKIKTKKVVFAVSSMGIGSKEETMPVMKENKRKDYIKTNTAMFFPVNPEKYQVAYRINGEGEEGKQRIQLYSVPNELVESFVELANACDLTLLDLEFVENGIAQSISAAYPKETIVNIAVEGVHSVITIITAGTIALQRNISYGINEAVSVVSEQEGTGYLETTEKMAKQCYLHESLDYVRGQDAVKDEVTEELRYIVNNVNRILEYYLSKNQGISFDKIFMTGMGSRIKGLMKLLEDETSFHISKIEDNLISVNDKREDDFYQEMLFSTVAAVKNPIGINLSLAKKVSRARELAGMSTARKFFIVCIIICILLTVIPLVRLSALKVQENALQNSIDSMAQAKEVYDRYRDTKAKYEELLQFKDMTEAPGDTLLQLFSEMESKLPTDVLIKEMTATDELISMTFVAPTQKAAAKTLEAFRSFESVRDAFTEEVRKTTEVEGQGELYEFVVICYFADTTPTEEGAE